jgi:hypothetical protein
MNNHECIDKAKDKFQCRQDSRRGFIKGVGLATPVVFTLASRSVLGAQCLSEMMSGNMSHTGSGSCVLGANPSSWRGMTVGNNPYAAETIISINGNSFIKSISSGGTPKTTANLTPSIKVKGSWSKDKESLTGSCTVYFETTPSIEGTYSWFGGIRYGVQNKYVTKVTKITDDKNKDKEITAEITIEEVLTPLNIASKFNLTSKQKLTSNKSSPTTFILYEFVDGDTYNDLFGGGDARPLREILNKNVNTDQAYLVVAMLNAKYYKDYVLSEDDVKELASSNNPKIPPNYTNLQHFLSSTWQ